VTTATPRELSEDSVLSVNEGVPNLVNEEGEYDIF
jgi:hypothetical protein